MKILAIERELARGATPEPLLEAEAARVWELHQSGVVRELYFRADRNQAVLVLECRDAAEAGEVLATLPLVREGRAAFDVVPLRAYPGFARLFADR